MDEVDVVVETHWLNGWFLRLFAVPSVVVDAEEHRATWGRAVRVPARGGQRVGVGVRYLGRSRLLGVDVVELDRADRAVAGATLVFRNGFWNHDPFRLVRVVPAGS